jgi:hypothetical protein
VGQRAGALRGGPAPPEEPTYAESLTPHLHFGWSDLRSLRDRRVAAHINFAASHAQLGGLRKAAQAEAQALADGPLDPRAWRSLLSVLLAIYLLGLRQGETMKGVMKKLEEAFKATASILLIVAGAGALKQILNDSQISRYIGEQLQYIPISPLVLGWGIAGAIRVAVGSATVAGLTTVGILAPLIQQSPIKPELMVLSIGAGSLMFSHLNDAGFWLFKEYFNLTIRQTLETRTVMETIVSVIGLIGVLLLNMVV